MSYFPDMFKPSAKGIVAFLVHVGEHETETVVYRLDEAGLPASFACGTAKDAIGGALRARNPYLRIVDFSPYDRGSAGSGPRGPSDWGFWSLKRNRWAELVRTLNGKSIKTGMNRERLINLREHGFVPEIRGHYSPYRLTQAGIEADAALDAEEAAEAAAKDQAV